MKDFRTEVAIILVDSKLNNDNIRNQDLEDDRNNTDLMDCMILDRHPINGNNTDPTILF